MQEQLKKLIKQLNISQKAFGEKIGIKPAYINDLIKGRAKGFSSETLILIQKVYHVNINWFLTGEGEMFITPLAGKDSTGITDFEQLIYTKWFENLPEDEKKIISMFGQIKDRAVLKKISNIMINQAVKERAECELLRDLKDLENA